MKVIILALCTVFMSWHVQARFEIHEFANEQMEEDYNVLVKELRCTVCQNQNLADSNAELAQDMRILVYKKLKEGNSKDQIVEFLVKRYGDFVIYRPPVKATTFLLWVGPLLFVLVAALIVFLNIRRQKVEVEVVDEKQQKKAKSLLDD